MQEAAKGSDFNLAQDNESAVSSHDIQTSGAAGEGTAWYGKHGPLLIPNSLDPIMKKNFSSRYIGRTTKSSRCDDACLDTNIVEPPNFIHRLQTSYIALNTASVRIECIFCRTDILEN